MIIMFLACTKRIDLRTEVEFEIAVEHNAMGYIDEALSTNITVVPEAVLADFSYTYSYSVSGGQGHFMDGFGKIIAQNENISLNPFSATLTYVGSNPGSHTVKITASDNYGFTEEVDIDYTVEKIIVEVEDNPETDEIIESDYNEITAFAIFGQIGDSRIDITDHTISLDVPFGTDLNVEPSVIAVSPFAEVNASNAGQRDFSIPVVYRVTAENGDTQEWTVIVNTDPKPNEVPTVDAGTDQLITVMLPEDAVAVSLNGTANDNNDTLTIEWIIESGDGASIANPDALKTEATGLKAGTYIFRLTATDNEGAKDTDTVTIKINSAPTADAGNSKELVYPMNTAMVTGLASDIDGTFTVKWTQVEIKGEAATILNPDALNIEITGLAEGLNVFELTVTDNDNAIAKDRMYVEVKRPEPEAQP